MKVESVGIAGTGREGDNEAGRESEGERERERKEDIERGKTHGKQ